MTLTLIELKAILFLDFISFHNLQISSPLISNFLHFKAKDLNAPIKYFRYLLTLGKPNSSSLFRRRICVFSVSSMSRIIVARKEIFVLGEDCRRLGVSRRSRFHYIIVLIAQGYSLKARRWYRTGRARSCVLLLPSWAQLSATQPFKAYHRDFGTPSEYRRHAERQMYTNMSVDR